MTIEHIWPDALHKPQIPGYDHPPFAQVVQVTRANGGRSIHISGTFGTDMDQFRATGLAEYMRFKSTTQTASTLVEITRLANPDALVEIEAYGEISAPAGA